MANFSAAVQPLMRGRTSVGSGAGGSDSHGSRSGDIGWSFYRPICNGFPLSDLSKSILAHRVPAHGAAQVVEAPAYAAGAPPMPPPRCGPDARGAGLPALPGLGTNREPD